MKSDQDEEGITPEDQSPEFVSAENILSSHSTLDEQLQETRDASSAELRKPLQIETVGRYVIQRLLGQGGFGAVYLARDAQLDRQVAIKIAHPEMIKTNADASLYMEEARNVAKLDHPHIVPVHDVGATKEIPFYFVSKFINGSNH